MKPGRSAFWKLVRIGSIVVLDGNEVPDDPLPARRFPERCRCPARPGRPAAVVERHRRQGGHHRLRRRRHRPGRRYLRARGRPHRRLRQRRHALVRAAGLFPGALRARRAAREGRGRPVDPDLRRAPGRERRRHGGDDGRRHGGARRDHKRLAFRHHRRGLQGRCPRVADHGDAPDERSHLCRDDLPADAGTARATCATRTSPPTSSRAAASTSSARSRTRPTASRRDRWSAARAPPATRSSTACRP